VGSEGKCDDSRHRQIGPARQTEQFAHPEARHDPHEIAKRRRHDREQRRDRRYVGELGDCKPLDLVARHCRQHEGGRDGLQRDKDRNQRRERPSRLWNHQPRAEQGDGCREQDRHGDAVAHETGLSDRRDIDSHERALVSVLQKQKARHPADQIGGQA
jgi:hypothetical protein